MFRKLMTVAALATVSASVATAQATEGAATGPAARPFTFGAFAGAAVPMGDFADAAKMGFSVGGNVGYTVAGLPVRFRLDGEYNQYSKKNSIGGGRLFSVTGNVVYDLPVQSAFRPYVLAGAGLYNVKPKGFDAENAFGFVGGAGVSIPLSGFDTYLEARYNQASKNGGKTQYVPVVFGIRF